MIFCDSVEHSNEGVCGRPFILGYFAIAPMVDDHVKGRGLMPGHTGRTQSTEKVRLNPKGHTRFPVRDQTPGEIMGTCFA